MEVRLHVSKDWIGNATLSIWLIAGTALSIVVITSIPDYFGDNAAAFLPAYVVASIVFLFAVRFGLERLINAIWPRDTDAVIWNSDGISPTGAPAALSIFLATSVAWGGAIPIKQRQLSDADVVVFSEDASIVSSDSDSSAEIFTWSSDSAIAD